ncbi:MAG TPA: hypothetical protein VHD60_00155 [Candidatus Saccharimonadales bacterium]|nr:hypothetical protein [Candidatus Saccharimonadales bacterium]
MKPKGRRIATVSGLTVATVAAVAVTMTVGGISTPHKADAQTAPSASSSASASATASAISQAVIDALTVKSTSVDCPSIVNSHGGSTIASNDSTVVKWNIGALKGTPPRKWSDAISVPLPGSTPADQLANLQADICEDPLLGSTWANMLANLTVDGVSVGSLNSWLTPFSGDAKNINAQAASFVTLLDTSNPTDVEAATAAKQNVAWQQQVAEKLDTLLGRFQVVGVQTLSSVQNWHLVAGGLQVGGLPQVGLNSHQEKLPALVLQVTAKGACAPLKVIGANVGDQRPEVFVTPTCQPPAAPSTSKTPPPAPKTTPGKPKPSKTPTPTPTPSKSKCPCVPLPKASQPVPTPAPQPSSVHVSTAPSAQPTQPVDTSSPPPPTPGGYNGGSSSQPGTTAPPTPVSSATQSGDPGGF